MKQSGITLISLVVTIIVMAILAGAGISIGTNSIRQAKKTEFDTHMKLIHARVNELKEEYELSELNNLGSQIPNDKVSIAQQAIGSTDISGYRYFNKAGLELINLVNIDREVVINFTTKDVVDLDGIESEGTIVYRLDNWTNQNYVNQNTLSPTFTLNKKIYGLNATILVENIVYRGNTGNGVISYCLMQGENEGEWHTTQNSEIPVSVSGTYKVKVTDSAGNVSQVEDDTIEITLTNKPKLDRGMTPVVYDETEQKWRVTDENSGIWYDYSTDKKQWANVMLQDGLEINADGTINEANMGSMFVWIPRYMYQIPSANYHKNTAGEISIKFLKGTTNIPTDESNVEIANASGGDNWNVHPAFCDGNKTDYVNGEWDKDITGIWVAKFEASSSNPSASYGGNDTTNLDVHVKPNIRGWNYIEVHNICTVCKKMTSNENIYNLSNNSDMHAMKNSEWGATAYISRSTFGKEGLIWNNPSLNHITGSAGTAQNSYKFSDDQLNAYNTSNGIKASSTGTIYGIYDLSAGAFEFVVAYFEDEEQSNTNVINLYQLDKKYKNTYKTADDNTIISNYQANSNVYGDAFYETSGSAGESTSTSWENDYSMLRDSTYILCRGGATTSSTNGCGAFNYAVWLGKNAYTGFRPICIVE